MPEGARRDARTTMIRTTARRTAPTALAGAVLALTIGTAGATAAAAAPPTSPPVTHLSDFVQEAPAGAACEFALRIEGTGGIQVTRTVGGTTTSVTTGQQLTYTNLDDPDLPSVTVRPVGITSATPNDDGTVTVELLGGNPLVLTPADDPAGPSVTFYTGRVVYTLELDESYTLVSTQGTSTDICAAISG
jgi:hypothetical protein